MRLLLVAYPGAGKGTQATKLSAHYGVARLSSGELLRAEVARGSRIGKVAADYLRSGDLVPDELVLKVLSLPLLEAAKSGGFILDGFPRTVTQAESAYSLARESDVELQAVIYLRVGHEELLRRLRARADAEGRMDDGEKTIANRFEVFEAQTEPLLGFYDRRGILLDIDGEQRVEDVFADITTAVNSLVG
jgi:adenylate kinase